MPTFHALLRLVAVLCLASTGCAARPVPAACPPCPSPVAAPVAVAPPPSEVNTKMTLEDLQRRAQSEPDSLWWQYRFIAAVIDYRATPSPEAKTAAVDAFVRLAIADPQWVNEAIDVRGPPGHGLSVLLSGDRLQSALSRLRLASADGTAMLRCRMLSAAANVLQCDTCDKGAADDLLRQAWAELSRVPEAKRDAEWRTIALGDTFVVGPAAIANYPLYRDLANEHLSSLTRDFDRSMFLGHVIPVAARQRDWPTFEVWVKIRRSLPEALVRNHAECEIVNLEGLRALDEGRVADAEAAMRKLLDSAPTTEFLSNEAVSALPKRLRAEGRALKL